MIEEPLNKNTMIFHKDELDKYFQLSYCLNIDNLQGHTFEEKYTVCDILHNHCSVKHLYVALSRAVLFDNITFCFNRPQTLDWNKKIKSYIQK